MIRLMMIVLIFVAACGDVSRQQHDAAVIHDAAPDSLQPPGDAIIDASPLQEAREFVNAGARITGPTYTFEIQMGHAAQQSSVTGSTYKLEGNAAIKP